MSRPPRLDYPGARHHVMNRGARRQPVFLDEADCLRFLGILQDLPRRFGIPVHAYALMPNHFHLLLSSPSGNLAAGMKHLTGTFVASTNRRRGWDGPVFRGRYRNRVVDSDRYWRHLLAYLHLNPVAAGHAAAPASCVWTSHAAYAGGRGPDWLDTAGLVAQFGGPQAYTDYVAGVQQRRIAAPPGFDAGDLWAVRTSGPAAGSERRGRAPVDEVLAEVARVVGREVSLSARAGRGRDGNPERWAAAWALVYCAGCTYAEVGALLGVEGAGVPNMLRRLVRRGRVDGRVAGWLEELGAGAG